MTEEEMDELRALNAFRDQLGISEMTDEQWERWLVLNDKLLKLQQASPCYWSYSH